MGGLTILAIAAGVAVGLYGLHRLALRLEDRGLIYYLKKSPTGGFSRALAPLQESIDPSARHVVQVTEESPRVTREDVPGPDA